MTGSIEGIITKLTEARKMHTYLSESFSCSGYCKPVELFTWNLPLSMGKADKLCRDDIKHEMYLIFMFPAIIAIIGAGASIIAFPTQYLLWKKYEADQTSQAQQLKDLDQAQSVTNRSNDVSGGPLYSDGDGLGNPDVGSEGEDKKISRELTKQQEEDRDKLL